MITIFVTKMGTFYAFRDTQMRKTIATPPSVILTVSMETVRDRIIASAKSVGRDRIAPNAFVYPVVSTGTAKPHLNANVNPVGRECFAINVSKMHTVRFYPFFAITQYTL